ncbi:hypothetical protein [Streptomyces goshikiensis]|uniref:hypothetical protein n=1 Tax=Streptomyces goshikiensis TaxID=1942 RepID=UPI00369FE1BA
MIIDTEGGVAAAFDEATGLERAQAHAHLGARGRGQADVLPRHQCEFVVVAPVGIRQQRRSV